ncbi:lactase-phlorizin hydrolase-like, partial [Trichoplusia ni]|uniref:Lactase-phlorizin hydrolase-like n=1 Tax=Trichoplusia ni TaxID=7111 RepID=A0A7E5VHE6_TRINI
VPVSFPPGFKFGAATASYQIEGGWNATDKGVSIWDRFVHEDPTRIPNNDNGDVACDSYNNWERDVEMAAELGLHFYRFSLSWSRILPTGFNKRISEDGVRYYNSLIDGLLARGIEPFVTLYHWDLPQPIQELSGWTNPLIAEWFAEYARVVYTLFGDRVKLWNTINEPIMVCDASYNTGSYAPGIKNSEIAPYVCNKILLLAHAKAWRIYDKEFKPRYHGKSAFFFEIQLRRLLSFLSIILRKRISSIAQHQQKLTKLFSFSGKVSITNNLVWFEPASDEYKDLAELALQNFGGRYSHPIYSKEGGWPPGIEEVMAENSFKRGYSKSQFPAFTQEEKDLVRGTYDFYAFNHYTTRHIRKAKEGETFTAFPMGDAEDLDAISILPEGREIGATSWSVVYPEGMRHILVWLREQYGDIEFVIAENGFPTYGGLEDSNRVNYHKEYLEQILLAINDGVNVTHYTAWSLMDNFEWVDGYAPKFGLYEVDFTDPKRTRTPRQSAYYYASVIAQHSLDVSTEMDLILILNVFSALLAVSCTASNRTFPLGFKFGAATASYQIEGGWNATDKGESIWDRFVHEDPTRIPNNDNGDVACDSYNNWERDVEMAAELGLHFYRFSLSWSRILPTGFNNRISEDGVRYYNSLIDGLLARGIEPFVTLYHWDLPQPVQELSGWTNPLIVDWFADYARVAYALFGDRVKLWLTFNEPVVMCDGAYNTGLIAPGILNPDIGSYMCNKVLLMAHAKAWRIYDEEFKPKYHGKVSLANMWVWIEPATEDDKDLAELALQNLGGRYSHPIYSKEGGWPPGIEEVMAKNSFKKGYSKSQFPAFTKEEKDLVRGTYDFYCLNHYSTRFVRKAKEGETFGPFPIGDDEDIGGIMMLPENREVGASSGSVKYPEGMRRLLVWLKEHYGDIEYVIAENGFSTYAGLEDISRIGYHKDYLEQVLLAINDGVNVTHYTAWSLMDNFQWNDGYTYKFGLYEVDFTDPKRTRTPRQSAYYYASVIAQHSLDVATE